MISSDDDYRGGPAGADTNLKLRLGLQLTMIFAQYYVMWLKEVTEGGTVQWT